MARKKTAAKNTAPKSAAKSAPKSGGKSGDPGAAMIEAALALAAESGWTAVTIAAVAEQAGVALGDALLFAPTRAHLLVKFLDRLDAANLEGLAVPGDEGSARDRLFDVLMRRFDLLNRKRGAVRAVMMGVPRDPPSAAMLACRVGRSAAALLGAAGISAEGLIGFARVQGLKAVMACALKAWMSDDSADMAKTMAALDKALGRAERLANFRASSFRSGRGPADAAV
ncbi:MAG: hypothetical protein K1X51_15900 [Rhodospirillaceae bacterium]|nr:hypothetical protein [Rhodospirillaceae bacterium]